MILDEHDPDACARCGHTPRLGFTVAGEVSGWAYQCQCGRLIPNYLGLSQPQALALWNKRNAMTRAVRPWAT